MVGGFELESSKNRDLWLGRVSIGLSGSIKRGKFDYLHDYQIFNIPASERWFVGWCLAS
jgi:hypothetical protein